MIVYHIEAARNDGSWTRLFEGLASRQDATDLIKIVVKSESLTPIRRLIIVEDKQYGN